MTKTTIKPQNIWVLTPLFGTLLFICLYFVATLFYPGGSQVDKISKGFSWTNNYWCNLLNENAINEQHNAARPIAMAAMFVLCLTLAIFWYIFPQKINFTKRSRIAIQFSGGLGMTIGMFLFTALHDTIINIASLCGLVATVGTFVGLHKLKWTNLLWLGLFNLILVAVNNILYYGEGLKLFLPVLQKFTFLFFLLWICLISIKLYRRQIKNKLV
ncbi:MAG: hypothetical protein H7Y01_14025 [Ferruginibacter sp.]|nr:hypothetical protein [Chitinophagaceae bacterium]